MRVNIKDVLDNIDINEVIEFYGEGDLLDAITKATAMEHFGLEEA